MGGGWRWAGRIHLLFLVHFWLYSEGYCTCAYGCSLLGERIQSLLYNYGWYEWYGLMSHGLGRLGGVVNRSLLEVSLRWPTAGQQKFDAMRILRKSTSYIKVCCTCGIAIRLR